MPSEGRTRSTKLFFTFPQCELTKEQLLANAKKVFAANLEFITIALENHEDGTPHLHAFIHLKDAKNYSFKVLDTLTGKRGNYQPARVVSDVLKYITKEDPAPLVEGADLQEYMQAAAGKKSRIMTVVAENIRAGGTFRDVLQEHPGVALQHKRKIEDLANFVLRENQKKSKLSWDDAISSQLESHFDSKQDRMIFTWLNRNIRKQGGLPLREKQLWIHSGQTKMGKTTLIENLRKYLNIYHLPRNEDFFCTWEDNQFDVAVIDEYKGDLKLTALNEWLGGATASYKRKGADPVVKTQNIPTIIVSNYSPDQVYRHVKEKNPGVFGTLTSRLLVVEVTTPINLFGGPEQTEEFDYEAEADNYLGSQNPFESQEEPESPVEITYRKGKTGAELAREFEAQEELDLRCDSPIIMSGTMCAHELCGQNICIE